MTAGVVRSSAPLLIVDHVVDQALIDDLVVHAEREGMHRSPMVRADAHGNAVLVPDLTAKARHDHRLTDESLTRRVQAAMVERLLPIVAQSFSFAPTAHEAFKIVRYDAGDGWFTPHRDNVTPDAAHRRLAVTIVLDEALEGGGLRFPELGPTQHRPHPGAAIVFPCGLLHEVVPVTVGTRRALLTFLW